MSAPGPAPAAPLWAITCYFNPQHYRRRLQNYHLFRSNLAIPLVTVEHSLDGRFELAPGDADILIQLPGRDVMWHKERLLNIALRSVPEPCKKIAWLDCDVVFQAKDWAGQAADALERYPVIQPFQDVCELGRDVPLDQPDHPANLRRGRSIACGLFAGTVESHILAQNMRLQGWNSGLGWAARREVLAQGLYDACVMGSGNRAIVCAQLGRFDYGTQYLQMTPRWAGHYLAWARAHFEAVQGNLGFVAGTLFHLWHGDLKDRRYADRHREFSQFEFDPTADIAPDEHGCWRWNSDKPRMHQYVRNYFAARREDG